jgi:hypothetical protein
MKYHYKKKPFPFEPLECFNQKRNFILLSQNEEGIVCCSAEPLVLVP